jgi:serine protease
MVVSAGNDDGLAVSTPGNCPGVIAVSGVRNVGSKVGFSSIGPEVTLAAPAGNCINTGANDPCLYPILTTTNSGTKGPLASTYSDSLDASLGTSFSAPLVAGTAALMISANPALTPAQVKSMLQSTARAFPTTSTDPAVLQCHAPNGVVQNECLCTTSTCGAGLLDAAAAVAAVVAGPAPTTSDSGGGGAMQIGWLAGLLLAVLALAWRRRARDLPAV